MSSFISTPFQEWVGAFWDGVSFLKTLKKASKFKKLPDTLAARAVIGNLAKNNPNFHAAQITTDPKTDDAVKKLLKVLKNKGPKKALKNLLGN